MRLALEAVHASPVRAVLHVTGGAAQSLGWVTGMGLHSLTSELNLMTFGTHRSR